MNNQPTITKCVICGKPAVTAAALIPVCEMHFNEYKSEAEKYLPDDQRPFYNRLQQAHRQKSPWNGNAATEELLIKMAKSKTITLRYTVKDRVWISDLKCPATITAIYISDVGTQYQCRWFDNREPKTAYFFENEVEDIPATEQPGFSAK